VVLVATIAAFVDEFVAEFEAEGVVPVVTEIFVLVTVALPGLVVESAE
jgi:hypothetical protein